MSDFFHPAAFDTLDPGPALNQAGRYIVETSRGQMHRRGVGLACSRLAQTAWQYGVVWAGIDPGPQTVILPQSCRLALGLYLTGRDRQEGTT